MKRAAFLILCTVLAALFAGLGVWQLERLNWKRALIATVDARLSAPAQDPVVLRPWSDDLAYTKVRVRGVFLHDHETLVLAVTERGAGYWVMTPLVTDAGVVLVNRGFVPSTMRAADAHWRPPGVVSVVGLTRVSEPNGAFLRSNAPRERRWYSRDVAAIASTTGLSQPVAPYFIDADATPNPGGYPVGGLTVVRFSNNHLPYAVIWFALAVLALAGAVLICRQHGSPQSAPSG